MRQLRKAAVGKAYENKVDETWRFQVKLKILDKLG